MPDVLRPGVLDGLTIAIAGAGGGPGDVGRRAAELGARVVALAADAADEEAVAAEVAAVGPFDVLVVDATAPFATAGGGLAGLRAAVDGGWNVVRAAVAGGWADEARAGGKIVLLAPGAADGEHAAAVGAALENEARTLSVEWARFGVRVTAVLGGDAGLRAETTAFLASAAGDYYSGCAFRPADRRVI
ncbi:hypothetical protein FSW04_23360 [Baekduia soli]|uniref:SDR family oxidoreductase n=1 Tax=Baekduia soli TaxID=496014 RepID=A0A5B8UC50_9ACTN|nr:hypothetical protein [Baekduia soli]QEC50231.1 hypothetical protein FSW04_23360 [Baekduia soli]